MNIKIDTRAIGDKVRTLDVQGEIDVFTSPQLKDRIQEILQAGVTQILINLKGVRYIDSSGIEILIGTSKQLKQQGGRLAIVSTGPQLEKIFEMTGLSTVIDVFATEELALTGF